MREITLAEFADRLNEIMPVLLKEFVRRQADELSKGKITLPQFLILQFLQRDGESKMTSLAQFMHVTTANMTGIVDRLVRDRYVIRIYDPKDRRIIKIKLTAGGNELVKKINEERRKMVIRIFGKISERDRQDYLRILAHIREVLTKEEVK